MQQLQERFHEQGYDYRAGSPHLRHWQLYDAMVSMALGAVRNAVAAGLPADVLEVGAGHGGYTEPLLAAGSRVTSTEMSQPSLAELNQRFGGNSRFSAVFDVDGSLGVLGDRRFSVIVCCSVLHHIPDYLTFIEDAVLNRLASGGIFLSMQDPLWYPRVSKLTHRLDRASYGLWRVVQGNYRQGVATLARRLRGTYDEENPADMVEYHVVRQGVDEQAIAERLSPLFQRVELSTYWSTQAPFLQWLGNRVGMRNTFAVVAEGRRAD